MLVTNFGSLTVFTVFLLSLDMAQITWKKKIALRCISRIIFPLPQFGKIYGLAKKLRREMQFCSRPGAVCTVLQTHGINRFGEKSIKLQFFETESLLEMHFDLYGFISPFFNFPSFNVKSEPGCFSRRGLRSIRKPVEEKDMLKPHWTFSESFFMEARP